MRHFSAELAHRIMVRHGIVTRDDLRGDGFTVDMVRRLADRSLLTRIHQGVYRVTTSPDTFESRCAAACAADAGAVVTGVAAGRLWGFRHVFMTNVPEVLVSHGEHPMSRGVVLRRTNVLGPEDIVERDDGIIIASPPRTWFDCAIHLTDEKFEMLTEWVLDRHAQMPMLWHTTRRLDARGRRGLARVQRVLSRRATWQKPADSGLELRVLRALERQGIELVRQYPIRIGDVVIHPDGADPVLKWAVEVDHVTWHGGRFEAQRDKQRDRRARKIGWQIERVTDQALADDFRGEIRELVEMVELRRTQIAA
jgi:very-short-patch-repair endonuclease